MAVTASTTGSATTPASASPAPSSTAADRTAVKSFATLFAAAKKDLKAGEHLEKVTGHPFARIKGGQRDEMCVNLSGNVRSGRAFDLITRGAHTFHVYGTGKDRVIVEVGGHKAAAQPDTSATTKTKDATTGGVQAKK